MASGEELDALRDYDTGDLGRVIEAGAWRVPDAIELDGDMLRWQFTGRSAPPVAPQRQDLENFLRLAEGSDQAIVELAGRVGPLLWLSDVRHDCPVGQGCPACIDATIGGPKPRFHPLHGAEPVEVWRLLARDASIVLEIAGLLHLGRPVDAIRWQELKSVTARVYGSPPSAVAFSSIPAELPDRFQFVPHTTELLGHRAAVAAFVSAWLAAAEVEAGVVWTDRIGPKLELRPSGFLGDVGLHFARAVAGAGGFAFCDGCGDSFSPRRRPKTGQRAFCDECRADGMPQRLADRDRRARQRAGTMAATVAATGSN